MNRTRKYLDDQLSSVNWTQRDRAAVLCAIREEKKPVKKKSTLALALTAALILMTTLALAVSATWGVLDFADRDEFVRENLPEGSVQQEISQSGGLCEEVKFSVTDAIYDGNTVYLTLLAEPLREGVMLMDFSLPLDAPASNLDKSLPRTSTIAEWCTAQGFTDYLGVDTSPRISGQWKSCGIAWHMEEEGACTFLISFEGVPAGETLEIEFNCATWGHDLTSESFSDFERSDSCWLTCQLQVPAE